jgi:glycosyltransferase involved in cell wall biosynthesis
MEEVESGSPPPPPASPPAPTTTVVLVEPFNCSSHAHLVRWLASTLPAESPGPPRVRVVELTLPGKKWHWRLRTSSVWAAERVPRGASTLLVSSMVNLSELLALRPDLHAARKVLYMHENQLVYPQRHGPRHVVATDAGAAPSSSAAAAQSPASADAAPAQRDFQFGWAQLLSLLCADVVAWNSHFNLESFLHALPGALATVPDKALRPPLQRVVERIRARSVVLYLPIDRPVAAAPAAPSAPSAPSAPARSRLRVGWNHRWEFDKGPDAFFAALRWLSEQDGADFEVVVLGEQFSDSPPVFAEAREWLLAQGRVAHWGYAADRQEYSALLASCDVAVSTAEHEFFGIALLEALALGVFPVAPHDLAYPETLAPVAGEAASDSAAAALARIAALVDGPRVEPFFAGPVLGEEGGDGDGAASSSAAGAGAGAGAGAAGGGLGRGQGRGAPPYTPPKRPSPHLYAGQKDLQRILLRFAREPALARDWRRARGDGVSEGGGGGAGGAASDSVPSKRARIDEDGGAAREDGGGSGGRDSGRSWPFASSTLAPLYRRLLLHGGR